ncbi:MAG TPA: substrate-binding domain-containing protein [Treponemataceae bacterium]|nr:substrate-binding domain-containing protein [Treponemataceae bacterium]HPS42854.1 substrate-binding domain-containing protein [Treponemataceae bacterium]
MMGFSRIGPHCAGKLAHRAGAAALAGNAARPPMRPSRRALAFFALFTAILALSSCSPGKFRPKKDRITIGFSIATDTFIIERWNKDIKIFSGAARDLGANVIVQLSAGGTKEQIAQIDFLMAQDIDVLVVVAHDTELLAGAVKKVRDAKIPVVAYDRLIMGTPIDAFVSFNNREVGRLFGKALLGKKPRGNYLIVNGSSRDSNSYEVNAGLHEVLDPAIKRQDVHVVEEIWLDEWSSDEALEKIGKVLDRTHDIDAISCANDQIASAAIQLLSEYRIAGKVAVVGQDADIGACQKIVEGTQLMTVYKPIASLATRAASIAVDVAKGAKMSPDRMVENRSGTLIPFFMEEPKAVFAENMDTTVIRDRFHSAEDVYRNVPVKK